jgi:hypothetical protein
LIEKIYSQSFLPKFLDTLQTTWVGACTIGVVAIPVVR